MCGHIHKYISEIEDIMDIPTYFSGGIGGTYRKYLLNTLSELSSASPQWGILEKDEQSPYLV